MVGFVRYFFLSLFHQVLVDAVRSSLRSFCLSCVLYLFSSLVLSLDISLFRYAVRYVHSFVLSFCISPLLDFFSSVLIDVLRQVVLSVIIYVCSSCAMYLFRQVFRSRCMQLLVIQFVRTFFLYIVLYVVWVSFCRYVVRHGFRSFVRPSGRPFVRPLFMLLVSSFLKWFHSFVWLFRYVCFVLFLRYFFI